MAKTVERKAPSRARYEQAHPTVSDRVPKEIYDRPQAIKRTEGRSFADFLVWAATGLVTVARKPSTAVR